MPETPQRRPERLFGDGRHRLVLFRAPGGSNRLVICFEPGRDPMDGFEPAQCPRFAERLSVDALLMQTAKRDWYIGGGVAALARALDRATAGYDEVTASGFSMGGYGALLYSRAARITRALLVSPQYSVDPQVAPYDPGRHDKFRRIGHPMPLPQSQGNPDLTGMLLYDPAIAADREHARQISRAFPRLTLLALPYGGHPATSVIGELGRVGRISTMLIEDRLDPLAIRRLHREARRAAPHYRLNLARAAMARHPDRALDELTRLAGEGSDYVRFEAGLALLALDSQTGMAALERLMDDIPDPPRAWARRIRAALAATPD